MKKITKSLIALAMLFVAGSASAERVYADLSQYGSNWDAEKGILTFSWTAPWGNQLGPNLDQIGLPKGDLSTWEKLVVVVDEDGLINCDFFRILVYSGTDTNHNNTFKANQTGINEFTLKGNVDFLNSVTRICLSGSNGEDNHNSTWSETPASFKVKEVYLERPDVVYITEEEVYAAPAGTTDLNGMTGAGSVVWNISYPQIVENETLWGGNIDGDNQSIDISAYDYLHFVVTDASVDANCGLRVFVSTEQSNGNDTRVCLYPYPIDEINDETVWTDKYFITSPGTYVVKISDYPLLRGFKALQGWAGNAGSITVSMAYVSSGDPVAYTPTGEYILVGTAALDDETACCFDVTAVTGTDLTFEAANPNALFIANEGTLANTKNVIVNGVCANLELTDQKPFMAPADFTATAASFSKTVTDAKFATMVLPFAAALPSGVEAFEITGNTGNVLTTNSVDAIEANKPVMLKNAGAFAFTASDVEVKAASGVQTNGLLNGVYATTDVPTDNGYVLQKQGEDVNFYKAGDGIKVNAFRAYLTAAAGARLAFDFNEATGIDTTINNNVETAEIFNLAGQRVVKAQKGLYIVNGKKVFK